MTQPIFDSSYNAVHEYDARRAHLLRRRHPLWRIVVASVWDFLMLVRQARVSLIGFALVMAVTTVYFLYGYHDYARSGLPRFSFFSAAYESLRLMVLESGIPIPIDDLTGEVLFFAVPLLGLGLIFQSILNFGRLLLDKGSRREGWQLSLARTFRQHVIICGLGSVAHRVIIQLIEAGYEVVVVQRNWDSELVDEVLQLKVPVIRGDARHDQVLRQAGIQRARSIIACTHDDLVNIEMALAARRQRPDLPVSLRIFNDELDTNLELTFGRNSAFSASALAAPTLAAAAIGRAIAHVLPLPEEFGTSSDEYRFLGVLQLTIGDSSLLAGDLYSAEDQFDIRVLRHLDRYGRVKNAWRSDARRAPPQIEPDDIVLLLGQLNMLETARAANFTSKQVGLLPRVFSTAPIAPDDVCYDTVIVCGLGRIGYRVVKSLQRLNPCPQIMVVCQPDNTPMTFVEEVKASGVRVLYGDGRSADVLQQAQISRACAVAAVTSDDLLNLQIGLAARRLHDDIDVVLRVFSDALADRLTAMFGVHTTFSISALAAPTLAASAIVRGINYAIEIADHILSTLHLTVHTGDSFAGQTVRSLRARDDVLVLALRRAGRLITPLKLDTTIEDGDELVVLVDIERLERLARDRPLLTDALRQPLQPLRAHG